MLLASDDIKQKQNERKMEDSNFSVWGRPRRDAIFDSILRSPFNDACISRVFMTFLKTSDVLPQCLLLLL